PQELLGLGQHQVAVGRGVLEDEVALAGHPGGALGELERLGRHALRPRLHERRRAADLADLEALVLLVAADEQLELGPARRRGRRRGGGTQVAHARESRSRPVASSPQRVTSATRSPEARSRSMKMSTRAWKKAAAARGLTSVMRRNPSRSSASRVASVSACTVAERGERSKRLISPKKSPGPIRARTCSTRPVTSFEITIEPLRTTNISSPGSPSRQITWPRRSGRSSRLCPRINSSGSAISLNSRTSRRKASVSAGVDTETARRSTSRRGG